VIDTTLGWNKKKPKLTATISALSHLHPVLLPLGRLLFNTVNGVTLAHIYQLKYSKTLSIELIK